MTVRTENTSCEVCTAASQPIRSFADAGEALRWLRSPAGEKFPGAHVVEVVRSEERTRLSLRAIRSARAA